MPKLIKNGDIILSGTKTRQQLERQAFVKLEKIERIMAKYNLDTPKDLDTALSNFVKTIELIMEKTPKPPVPPSNDNQA